MPAGGRMFNFTPFTTLLLLLLAPSLLAEKTKCDVCKDMTKHFMEHFNKTKGHNFGGGNTAWEEKSLGTYATSETRLVEIQEKTAKKCDYRCGSLLEDQEEFLEEWFFKRQDKTDLFEELCVDHTKRCCPKNRWGPDCKECPGGVESPCNGKGRCRGEGDRDAKAEPEAGTCQCKTGYIGTLCEGCNDRFVRVGENCEECSKLCKSQKCTAPGPKGCVECRMGYEMLEETGCTDINECEREGMGCGDPLENCVNSAGSYECVCKTGYKRVDGKCQLEDLYASEDEEDEPVEGAETKEPKKEDENNGDMPDEVSKEGDDSESDDYEEVIEPDESEDTESKNSDDDSPKDSETAKTSEKDEL